MITIDKLHHCVYSYAICKALQVFLPIWAVVAITIVVGISKEVYDKESGKGSPEWLDLVADVIGTALAIV